MAWREESLVEDILSLFAEAQHYGNADVEAQRFLTIGRSLKRIRDEAWKAAHPEKMREYRRAWKLKKHGKRCSVCGEQKKKTEFRLRSDRSGHKRRPECVSCHARQNREWKRRWTAMRKAGVVMTEAA